MTIIRYRTIFLTLSLLLVLASWGAVARWGLTLGIDFTGGSIVELLFTGTRPEVETVREKVRTLSLGEVSVQPTGEQGFIVRARPLSQSDRTVLVAAVSSLVPEGQVSVTRFDSIGPTIGKELARKALWAIVLVVLLIIAYIAFVFRSVSKPVASWKYGVAAVLALIHDVSIPTGVFAYLGATQGVEVNALFLTALLATLGLSVSDTIVVFDRVRENLQRRAAPTFVSTVGVSLDQVFRRSLIISLTTIIALLSIYFFGGAATQHFALALLIGMVAGTYSSLFVASPLLILFAGKHATE